MDIDIDGHLPEAADPVRNARHELTGAQTDAVAREHALAQAEQSLARAHDALFAAADAIERAGPRSDTLAHVAQIARTQAHLADALTGVMNAPDDERIELLLAMLAAARGEGPSGRH